MSWDDDTEEFALPLTNLDRANEFFWDHAYKFVFLLAVVGITVIVTALVK